MASVVGLNKMFILDKYFTELNKYWASEYQQEKHQQQKYSTTQSRYQSSYPWNNNTSKIWDCGGGSGGGGQTDTGFSFDMNDLIHLDGPITEDSLIRALHARFLTRECFSHIGPVLISLNTFEHLGNALTLSSAQQQVPCYPLLRVVHEAVRQQTETGYPQAIILSGSSGSGKTYTSMIVLRQLFNVVGGGPETDAFKHLAAAFTVLRSLGSAKTISNSESSRIGNFIELQVTDGAIYRTKIHCYFLDQSRVVRTAVRERNYHIFYQMLAGLSSSEKTKLYLDGYSIEDFRYLNNGDLALNVAQEATRFQAWKSCLSVLGIPFMEVVRVLAAVLLLGNIQFESPSSATSVSAAKEGYDVGCKNSSQKKEIQAVANLLGVSSTVLYKGFVTMTCCGSNGQLIKSQRTAESSQHLCDSLAKALYIRTVATIIRRANSSKRLASSCGTTSSESNESVHNQVETSSSHHAPPSSIGSACGKSYRTMAVLNNAVRFAMDGFIGILDMFGFEDGNPSRLEQLCINLCAETMQHFYNTHIFKSSIESCRDEGVKPDIEIDYVDNVPCIDLVSSLRTGLFSMIDGKCRMRGTSESLVEKIKSQHHSSGRFFEVSNANNNNNHPNHRNKSCLPPATNTTSLEQLKKYFGIRHFVCDIIYDTTHFLEDNADKLADDIISVFHKSSCTFGFVSHLFGSELRLLNANGVFPRGHKFRISPTSHLDPNNTEPSTTLTQDFHSRLDNLLRTLVHARPHFVRCIKVNDCEQNGVFDRVTVMRQIRALQLLETVNLMAGGLPHRMRFKAFISRYRLLVFSKQLTRDEEKMIDDCKCILSHFEKSRLSLNYTSAASTTWILGKKHIFLSEGARQQLELVRNERRHLAATLIQTIWKGYVARRKWPYLKQSLLCHSSTNQTKSSSLMIGDVGGGGGTQKNYSINNHNKTPRPQPISGTPPPPPLFNNVVQQQQSPLPPPPHNNNSYQHHHKPLQTIANCNSNNNDNIIIDNTATAQPDSPQPEMLDPGVLSQAAISLGIDLACTPPPPPCRPYTVVNGLTKQFFPQMRTCKMDYLDPVTNVQLVKGQKVTVLHPTNSATTGAVVFNIQLQDVMLEVPNQYFEYLSTPATAAAATAAANNANVALCI